MIIVENDLEEMDHNELRNNECYEMQKNRQKCMEDNELAFNATNGMAVNVGETDNQENGVDDSENDCNDKGSDNTTNLQEKYNADYDDTGGLNEGDDDYGIDDTAPSEEDNNDPGDDDTPPRSRLVSCVYCSGVFGSYPQWLGHALEYHPGRVQRDPQRNDGIKRTCPYCPGSFWKADRLLRYQYTFSALLHWSTTGNVLDIRCCVQRGISEVFCYPISVAAYLPPADEVWCKVMFLRLCVIRFT